MRNNNEESESERKMSSSLEVVSAVPNEGDSSANMTMTTTTAINDEDDVSNNEDFQQAPPSELHQQQPPRQIIRYSTSTLFALRSSKLSQQKPLCKNMDLSCMIHHKPPPKMLIANMMPKFALNQMQGRGEESISPLSFHSNSSSSSNLSYQKRFQDGSGNGGNDGYSNSRYYYNKYKNQDEIGGGGGGGGSSSRIIYKTTGANTSNGNSIRFLKKAYSSKYENHEESTGSSVQMLSNKNILDNASRVITVADYRNTKKKMFENGDLSLSELKGEGRDKKMPSDEANNNSNNQKSKPNESERMSEVNANDLTIRNDLNNKKLPDDITNHLDDIFNDMSLNSLLDDKIADERESSRFSKWFNMSSADGNGGGGGSGEEKDGNKLNNSQMSGNNNSTMFSVQETEKYFQPIDKMENNSLFNFAQRQQPTAQKSQKSPGNSGQVHSVEELEAKLRHHKGEEERKMGGGESEGEKKVLQNFFQQQLMPNLMQSPPQQHQQAPQQQQQQQPSHQNQEEINAFKKLLSQIAPEERKISPQMMPGTGPNVLQQLMFQKGAIPMGKPMGGGKMMNPPHMMPPQQPFGQPKIPSTGGPLPEMIIKRPEVQALVQELTSGEISQYNLWQRLTAPGLSHIEHEIITCALNIFNANSNNGNAASMFAKQQPPPPMSNNLFPSQQQQQQPTPQANPANAQALHQLMQMKAANALTAPIPIPPQTSPLSPVPPLDQHLLFQHQAAVAANKQLRLSPLPAGMPQRIPSPRELQYHTQSIMQNALIRKKLEEQRENYRKRQEQEKQENAKKSQQDVTSSSSGDNLSLSDHHIVTTAPSSVATMLDDKQESPGGVGVKKPPQHIGQNMQRQHAPSPSIFTLTPTSVLRKMTAEKENDSKSDKKKSLGMPPQQQQQQQQAIRNPQQQQQQQPFMGNFGPNGNNLSQMDRIKMAQADVGMFGGNAWDSQSMQGIKPIGRPIVKSSPVPQSQNPMMAQQNNQVPSSMMNFDFQQQQQQQQQMQKMNLQKTQFLQQQQMMQMKKQQMDNPVLSQFMAQQQQRAQAQAQSQFRSMNFPMNMQHGGGRESNKTSDESQMENRNMMNNGGCLSPTSNQLAKWFSPELLADGKLLPSLNNLGGQMLSLEELEKCMQNS